MSAADIVRTLQQRGVEIWQEGGALRYRAPVGALTDSDKAALREHKTAILLTLAAPTTPIQAGLTPTEREDFEERAAIMEHDGGLTRTDVERAALMRTRATCRGLFRTAKKQLLPTVNSYSQILLNLVCMIFLTINNLPMENTG